MVSVLASCGVPVDVATNDPQGTDKAPALTSLKDDLGTIPPDIRFQRADIIPVGPNHFAVGYVAADGDFRYARYNTSGAVEVPSTSFGSSVIGGGINFTIRANTSSYLAGGTCLGIGTRFINFAAVQLQNTVFLDTHTYGTGTCGYQSWKSMTRAQIDTSAFKPAVASQGTYENGRALVVYGKGTQLRGRFWNWSTNFFTGSRSRSLGDPFVIADVPSGGGIFSSDVIFNQHPYAGNFIVGFVNKAPMLCRVGNVVVSGSGAFPPAIVRGPVETGRCDGDQGGHATSAAYSPLLSDGTYLWWSQGPGTFKSVRILWANGDLGPFDPYPTAEPTETGTVVTIPITATSNAQMPYMFLAGTGNGGSKLMGMRPDKTWTCLDCAGLNGNPIAVRSFPNVTVALTALAPAGQSSPDLRLYVSDQH